MLAIEELKDRHIYELVSRNLHVGVWDAQRRGFNGIRQKFGDRYIFMEYHWDADARIGTARPIKELGELPPELINAEHTGYQCKCGRPTEPIPGATSVPWDRHVDDKTPMEYSSNPTHTSYIIGNTALLEFLEPFHAQVVAAFYRATDG